MIDYNSAGIDLAVKENPPFAIAEADFQFLKKDFPGGSLRSFR
jgi:hypothetical protein